MQQAKPIIVIRKKSGHGGHHGGAWKVAYADFVTALMSLFIVLWLMNTSEKVRQAVAGYFNDPRGKTTLTGTDQSGSSDSLPVTVNNIPQLKKRIEEAIRKMNDLKALQNQIQITITPEGLRIELLETKDGTFFDTGSAKLTPDGEELLKMLAGQLGGIPNRVAIEGHTDAQQYANPGGYDNWDLSSDRANSARRLMQSTGLRKNQVSEVRGYGDQKPRLPNHPMDPSNRRISLIVQYLTVAHPVTLLTPGQAGAKPGAAQPSQPSTAASPIGKSPTENKASEGTAVGGKAEKPAAGKPKAALMSRLLGPLRKK
jgi:chemotaxis protein MotB